MMVRKMSAIRKTMNALKMLSAAAVTAVLLAGGAMSAAGSENVSQLNSDLDLSKKGSVELTIVNTTTGAGFSGINLELTKVADIVKGDNGQYAYAYTDAFTDCTVTINDLSEANVGEREKAATVQTFANQNNIRGTSRTTDTNGKVKYSDLDLGVYLIQNYPVTENKESIRPFLVTVPRYLNGKYDYTVDATSKPEAADIGGGGGDEPKGDKPKDTDDDEPKGGGGGGNPGGGGTPGGGGGSKLPQTGQLWWPVPVLALAGLVLVIFGLVRRKNGKKSS